MNEVKHNNHLHADKIKLRRFAPALYFPGEARRYVSKEYKP